MGEEKGAGSGMAGAWRSQGFIQEKWSGSCGAIKGNVTMTSGLFDSILCPIDR